VTKSTRPKLPLPAALVGSEVGSFTEYTVTQRMPDIARRVVAENNYPADINKALEKLASELSSGNIPALADDTASDVTAWQKNLEPYNGQRWIDIPWFVAETYFYRVILANTNYFRPGRLQYIDPFALQKQQGLESTVDSTIALCSQLNKWLDTSQTEKTNTSSYPEILTALLYFALWGNRVDLSLWSAFETDRSRFDIGIQQANILVDDTSDVVQLLINAKGKPVDFVLDNAGFELICDLCLVDFLLASGLASQVKLHVKPHPTFVSDAMIKDVHQTIQFLAAANNWDATYFAHRLQDYLDNGRIIFDENLFWTSPNAFWEIPETLKNDLSPASCLIVKGDANYRRLLGDLHWDYTSNINDIVCYLPVPVVPIRTLKSEVAAGLKQEVIERVAKVDSSWLTNGQWGVIHLIS
jgi:Damage-control phosphatase ARMT1-like domain